MVELHAHFGSVLLAVKLQSRHTSPNSSSSTLFPLQSHQPEVPKQFEMLRLSLQAMSRQGSRAPSFLQSLVALHAHVEAWGQFAHFLPTGLGVGLEAWQGVA